MSISRKIALTNLASISLAALSAQPAQALLKSSETTFDFVSGESLNMTWSYDDQAESDNIVSLEELESWSYSFLSAAGSEIYNGVVVSDGLVNSLNETYASFSYDTISGAFNSFDTGEDFEYFAKYEGKYVYNGYEDEDLELVSTPEPSLILGFITLGGVLLGSKRKTNK